MRIPPRFLQLNTIMSLNDFSLFVFHIFFIVGTVYFSYNLGKSHGASDIVSDMIDRKLFTLQELKNKYLD